MDSSDAIWISVSIQELVSKAIKSIPNPKSKKGNNPAKPINVITVFALCTGTDRPEQGIVKGH